MKAEMNPEQQSLLESREQYAGPTEPLESADKNCGDERDLARGKTSNMQAAVVDEGAALEVDTAVSQAASEDKPYIHIFGGGLFPAYTGMVLKLVENEAVPTFAQAAVDTIETLRARGIVGLGVHSDTHAEHDTTFHADHTEGPVGCGYAQKRGVISQLIHDDKDKILRDIQQLRPDLFEDEANLVFAHQVFAAHGLLAQDTQRLGSGREVVVAAAKTGAPTMVVDGDHVAKDGIINDFDGTSFRSGQAYAEGNPVYVHDIWASTPILANLYPETPLAKLEIASLIDIVGTMRALGVETIAYRSEPVAA